MKKWSNRILLIVVLLFLSMSIIDIPFSLPMIAILSMLILGISLYYSRGLSKIFGLIMMIVGTIVLALQKASVDIWMEGITSNIALVCLITIVPILSIPIHIGRYDEKLAQFATRFNEKPQRLFTFISGAFMILGPITNLGAIHILHSMLSRLKLPNSFLARSYVRGFTSINTWAPYFMSVFLVVYSLEIPMSTFLPYGLILSVLQIIVANVLFSMREVKTIEFEQVPSVQVDNPNKLLELLAVIIGLTAIVFFFERRLDMNVSALIIIAVLFISFIWSLYLKEPRTLTQEASSFSRNIFPRSANEIGLLISAGFFSVALSMTVLSTYINRLWMMVGEYSVFLLMLGTIIFVAVLSMIGIHQIVTISSIIASVSYAEIGMSDVTMAMTMLAAWAASTTLSPITPLNIVVSSILKESVFTIIYRWNFTYSLIVMIVHATAIYMIHLLS